MQILLALDTFRVKSFYNKIIKFIIVSTAFFILKISNHPNIHNNTLINNYLARLLHI